jgi:hypothetical protein
VRDWIPVVIAGVSALGAVLAAAIAGRSAARSKDAELQAGRLLELERHLSTARTAVFAELIEVLMNVMDLAKSGVQSQRQQDALNAKMTRCLHSIPVYASDETVRAIIRFMQATYADAPGEIVLRLAADLLVTVRRELGYPRTTILPVEMLATRINDAYADDATHAALTDPLEQVFARYQWTPPWQGRELDLIPAA